MSEERKAAGSTSPFDLWQEWYRQSEQFWGKAFEQTADTSAFASMMGQTLDAYVSYAKALREQTTRSLETMNLASRDDFVRLAAQVVALEEKIDTLEDKLDRILDRLDGARQPDKPPTRASARPRRTK